MAQNNIEVVDAICNGIDLPKTEPVEVKICIFDVVPCGEFFYH